MKRISSIDWKCLILLQCLNRVAQGKGGVFSARFHLMLSSAKLKHHGQSRQGKIKALAWYMVSTWLQSRVTSLLDIRCEGRGNLFTFLTDASPPVERKRGGAGIGSHLTRISGEERLVLYPVHPCHASFSSEVSSKLIHRRSRGECMHTMRKMEQP